MLQYGQIKLLDRKKAKLLSVYYTYVKKNAQALIVNITKNWGLYLDYNLTTDGKILPDN